MDFVERWFHFSPDGGNGLTELLYIALPILAVVAVARLVSMSGTIKSERQSGE